MSIEHPILEFASHVEWTAWLEENHATTSGVWIRIAKKASGIESVAYPEVLDVALCYGWIDGQRKRESQTAFLQKFTRRGKKSTWSKVNREKALSLIENGQMKPAGLQEVARARKDGRWDAAYDAQSAAPVPGDLQAALKSNKWAEAFFRTLDSRNRYAILFRLHNAKKPETRERRIQKFVEMLTRGEKIYP
jgi:uncharacterized protein YdeI (YjbR/CyaY-like superfamily)